MPLCPCASCLGAYIKMLYCHSITLTFLRVDGSGGSGGGGPGGPDPPPFGPRCRLFNIGPKVGPPPFVNVQEWGCFSNFLRSDDVTRTMSKGGGVLVKNLVSVPGPPPLSKILDPRLDGDVLVRQPSLN